MQTVSKARRLIHSLSTSGLAAFLLAAACFGISAKILLGQTMPPGATIELTAGFALQRTLGPSDEHVYTVAMESGAAIIGEADQEDVDILIEIYDSNGGKIARLDSPNGTQGPEKIDFTALQSGRYRLIIRAADKNAKPGKYLLKVDRILGSSENARRLAKQSYSDQALYQLWEASLTDEHAVEKFIADRKDRDPVLTVTPINASESRVTYLIPGDTDTERVVFSGGPDFGVLMRRMGQTNLFIGTQLVANDARFEYSFILREVHHAGPKGEVEIAEVKQKGPWLLQMPNAPRQPYLVPGNDTPRGKVIQTTIKSNFLS